MTVLNRKKLIEVAVWAGGEDVRRRLGLPSHWDQEVWIGRRPELSCGTACCIAGKVTQDAPGVTMQAHRWDYEKVDYVKIPWETATEDDTVFTYVDGEQVDPEEYAQRTLGLDYEQAADLFSGGNDLDDIVRIIGDLLREAK